MRSLRYFAATGAAAALVLAGCSSGGGDTTQSTEAEQNDAATEAAEGGDVEVLTVGASPSPHGSILTFINDNLAAEAGLRRGLAML